MESRLVAAALGGEELEVAGTRSVSFMNLHVTESEAHAILTVFHGLGRMEVMTRSPAKRLWDL